MTITNGYTDLATYKTWIAVRGLAGSVGTDASDDSVIEILIEGASRYIDQLTGRRFYADSVDATRYYQARSTVHVRIDDLSAAPTSVSVDTSNTRDYTALTSTSYDLLPDNALLIGRPYNAIAIAPNTTSFFPLQRRGVRVIGKFGFPAVPTDIKEATLMIAQNVYSSRSGQSSSGRITVTAAGLVIRPEEVPSLAQSIIAAYRKRT